MENQITSDHQTKIMLPTNMARRKKIVLKALYDQTVIKIVAEKLKDNVFPRKGFHKPKPNDIELISLEKYYEQYLIIKGKYSIDHCKSLSYCLEVEKGAHEVFLFNETLRPETSNLDQSSNFSTIKINGVAHFHYDNEARCIIDKNCREIESKELEGILKGTIKKERLNKPGLRKKIPQPKILPEEEINLLRTKLVNRPENTGEVIKEKFDINERNLIYVPLYELNFRNKKTEKEAVVRINGVSGKIVLTNFINKTIPPKILDDLDTKSDEVVKSNKLVSMQKLSEPDIEKVISPIEYKVEEPSERTVKEKTEKMKSKKVLKNQPAISKKSKVQPEKEDLEFFVEAKGDVFYVGDNVTAIVGDLEIPSGTTVHDTLVVKGNLSIGSKCKMLATIKALGNIVIGPNTIIKGNVISNQNVSISPGVQIYGEVIIKEALHSRFSTSKGSVNE